jgi:hypothetical protein
MVMYWYYEDPHISSIEQVAALKTADFGHFV